MTLDLAAAYRYTTLIVGIGLGIKALETLYLLRAYSSRQIFDFSMVGNDFNLEGRLALVPTRLYSKDGVAGLASLSLMSLAILLLTESGSAAYSLSMFGLIVANVLMYYRQAFGLDGADQMSLLILLTLLLCSAAPSREIREIGLCFIALQLALSYMVSGVAKLASREWRSGRALEGILSTHTYGTALTRKLVSRHKLMCRIGCWGVIITEMALPFGLLLGPAGVIASLSIGLCMHLVIAAIMGLNDFVWSFAAAYPAFIYVGMVLLR
jgi:hypothetical protein